MCGQRRGAHAYEFGVKVSITTTHKERVVVGTHSIPGNPYDGHTLAEAMEQAAALSDTAPEVAIVGRGYKGVDTENTEYESIESFLRRLKDLSNDSTKDDR